MDPDTFLTQLAPVLIALATVGIAVWYAIDEGRSKLIVASVLVVGLGAAAWTWHLDRENAANEAALTEALEDARFERNEIAALLSEQSHVHTAELLQIQSRLVEASDRTMRQTELIADLQEELSLVQRENAALINQVTSLGELVERQNGVLENTQTLAAQSARRLREEAEKTPCFGNMCPQ